MPSQNSAPEVDKLVARYPPATQELIAEARRVIQEAFPGVAETTDTTARVLGYSYGPGYRGLVATLILSKTGAKIGIPYGATLPDPTGLLVGTGKVHRSIPLASLQDLTSPTLRKMLKVALRAWQQRMRAGSR